MAGNRQKSSVCPLLELNGRSVAALWAKRLGRQMYVLGPVVRSCSPECYEPTLAQSGAALVDSCQSPFRSRVALILCDGGVAVADLLMFLGTGGCDSQSDLLCREVMRIG